MLTNKFYNEWFLVPSLFFISESTLPKLLESTCLRERFPALGARAGREGGRAVLRVRRLAAGRAAAREGEAREEAEGGEGGDPAEGRRGAEEGGEDPGEGPTP